MSSSGASDRRQLESRPPTLRGNDDQSQDDETQGQGREQRFDQRIGGTLGQPLMNERDEPDDGEEVTARAQDHGRTDLRRRAARVHRLQQLARRHTEQPASERHPRRSPGPAMEFPVGPEAVGDRAGDEHGDKRCIDRRVEDLRRNASHKSHNHRCRPHVVKHNAPGESRVRRTAYRASTTDVTADLPLESSVALPRPHLRPSRWLATC